MVEKKDSQRTIINHKSVEQNFLADEETWDDEKFARKKLGGQFWSVKLGGGLRNDIEMTECFTGAFKASPSSLGNLIPFRWRKIIHQASRVPFPRLGKKLKSLLTWLKFFCTHTHTMSRREKLFFALLKADVGRTTRRSLRELLVYADVWWRGMEWVRVWSLSV